MRFRHERSESTLNTGTVIGHAFRAMLYNNIVLSTCSLEHIASKFIRIIHVNFLHFPINQPLGINVMPLC